MTKPLMSLLVVCALSAAVVASSPMHAVEVRAIDLDPQSCHSIVAKGDCLDFGPTTWCGEEEYCTENSCTGEPKIVNGVLVKDCQKVNLHDIRLIWSWYYPCMEVETGWDLWCEWGKCKSKCNCDDFCTDHDPDPQRTLWLCDVTDTCIETGNFLGVWEMGDICPEPGS